MKKNNFVYNVEEIKKRGKVVEDFQADESIFYNSLSSLMKLRYLNVMVEFSTNPDGLFLNGKIEAVVDTICSKCGREITTTLIEGFNEVYNQHGDIIDIEPVISETLTLAEPMRILCAKDCEEINEKNASKNTI